MDSVSTAKATKPLGGKAYGSIPHLPGSRRGPADYGCHEGQARIATEKTRDRHDHVIVQEKLDGSCVAVAKVHVVTIPLSRAGYHARTSPFTMHHKFADWVSRPDVAARFDSLLADGERVCGEWLYQAHGTRYVLPHEPLVVFDIFRDGARVPYDEFSARAKACGFTVPRLIHRGEAFSVADAMAAVETSGHGAIDPVEGAVWRVERNGKVDYLVKFVRSGKVDGCYLPDVSGTGVDVLNEWPASVGEF